MEWPEPVEFAENWWVDPLEPPGQPGVFQWVLQSLDGATRLVVSIDPERDGVGLRRQIGTVWLDQVWVEGVRRLWFDEDGRLYGEGGALEGPLSLWVEKEPVPRYKLHAVSRR